MNEDKPQASSLFIVISAPSGAGKTSICRQFLAKFPNLNFSLSYTTRAPRPGEKNGKDYYFISEKSFQEKIDRGEFVEWVQNYGQFYGTSKLAIESCLERGFDLLIDVEPRGAGNLKKCYPGGIFIFILPPSMEELKNRLMKRGCDDEGEISRRLSKAYDEIKEVVWYDYVIFNDRLDEAVEQLRSIYVAERARRGRLAERISHFLNCS